LGALAGERIGRNPERGAGTKGISKKRRALLDYSKFPDLSLPSLWEEDLLVIGFGGREVGIS
jgi:hypothetical protein